LTENVISCARDEDIGLGEVVKIRVIPAAGVVGRSYGVVIE
jgi:hypothetical protein